MRIQSKINRIVNIVPVRMVLHLSRHGWKFVIKANASVKSLNLKEALKLLFSSFHMVDAAF